MVFTKSEAMSAMLNIMDWMDHGVVEKVRPSGDKIIYHGHPAFYFLHSHDEAVDFIKDRLTADSYDEYSLCYELLVVLKFLLGPHDSHTGVRVASQGLVLPLTLHIQGDHAYVLGARKDYSDALGGELLSINGVPVGQLLAEDEQLERYATAGCLHHAQEICLSTGAIRILPSFTGSVDRMNFVVRCSDGNEKRFCTDGSEILRDPDWLYVTVLKSPNYTYDLAEDYLVLHYTRCRELDRMEQYIQEVDQLVTEHGYRKCIVDIRHNMGGGDAPSDMLCGYLRGKFTKLVALVDEMVYSSGMSTCLMLRDIGAYTIGTDIGDSPCAFGNAATRDFLQYGLIARCSQKFMVAEPGRIRSRGYVKEQFAAEFHAPTDLPEFWYFHPDLYVDRTFDDMLSGRDPQMDAALSYLRS